jgi:hypothetical protein
VHDPELNKNETAPIDDDLRQMADNYHKLQDELQVLQIDIKQKECNEKVQYMSLERKIEEILDISSKSVSTIQVFVCIHMYIVYIYRIYIVYIYT